LGGGHPRRRAIRASLLLTREAKKGETRTGILPSRVKVAGPPAESRRGETYFPFFFFEAFFAFVFFGMFSTSGPEARSRERVRASPDKYSSVSAVRGVRASTRCL
jgi:hypothetical protein